MNKRYDFRLDGPSIAVVDTVEELRPLAAEWDALCARDREAGLFLTPRWLIPAMLSEPGKWLVLTARDATGRLVGLLPLWRRRFRNKTTGALRIEVDAAGRIVQSPYSGFVCDPVAEGEALDAMAAALRDLDWTEFALPYVAQTERLDRFVAGFDPRIYSVGWPPLKSRGGAIDNHHCPRLALPRSFDAYLSDGPKPSASRKLRQAMDKHLGRGSLRIEDAAKNDRFDTVLDHALTVWQPRGGKRSPAQAERLERMLLMARAQGLLTMPALFQGQILLGALFNITDARTGYELNQLIARGPDRDDVPVGLLLHSHAIRTAIQRGLLIYDFGHGDDAYKFAFGADDRVTKSLFILRQGARG